MFPKTQSYIQKMLNEGVMPGVVYAFIDGRTQQTEIHSFGYQSIIPEKTMMLPDTLFDIASLTKVVGTTTVIFQLLAEKKLALTDPVNQYLPIQSEQLTVADLLLHQSDFEGYIPNRNELAAEPLKQALLTQINPGSQCQHQVKYSDVNYLYLGWIVEEILGEPIQTVIEKRVIAPLGLKQTTFHPDKQAVASTEQTTKRGLIKGEVHDPKAFILGEHCGSAGLFSNINDLIQFVLLYLNHGQFNGQTLIDESLLNSLDKPQTTLDMGQLRTYGWVIEPVGDHFALTHTGYTGTYLWIDLTLQRGFIFLSNRIHPVDDNPTYLRYRDELIRLFASEQ